jgi:acetylornithine deacetylase
VGSDPVPFLERAVPCDSTADVGPMRALLVDALDDSGVDAHVDAAGNVRASRGGGAPHVLFNTHIDTVPPHVPFSQEGDRIAGRGSCDAKGPLAAMVAAFLDAEFHTGTLSLAITPDEETLSTGAHALVTGDVVPGGSGETGSTVDPLDADDPPPSMVVVGEPTGLDVCTAARGRFEGRISLSGTAAHAADPAAGANAVGAAGAVLRAMETFENVAPHEALGDATLVPTGIEGGEATNQVPADCSITFDRRSVPPETASGFRSALEAHVAEALGKSFPGVGVDVSLTPRETPFLEAFATDEAHELVATLSSNAARVATEDALDGARGAVRPFGAATEASYFADYPTVVFGPGDLSDDEGAVAHAEREYVDVREVRAAARTLQATVERLLGE